MSVKRSDSKRLLAHVDKAAPGIADWDGSDVPAVRDDLRALRDIVEGTARGTGEEFFRSLVRRAGFGHRRPLRRRRRVRRREYAGAHRRLLGA